MVMEYHSGRKILLLLSFLLFILAGFTAEVAAAPAAANEAEIRHLRRSVQALNRVREQAGRELEKETAAGRLSRQDQEDYRTFINYLGGRVEKYCRDLFHAGGPEAIAGLSCPDLHPGLPSQDTAASTAGEQVNSLENILGRSLGDFDEMLLREQDRLASRQSRQRESAGSGSTSSTGSGGQNGKGTGSSTGENAGQGKGEKGDKNLSRESTAGVETGSAPAASKNTTGEGQAAASSRASRPENLEVDDDIVARQLREAAEKETDPELKEKLWEEYRKYKSAL